MKAYKNWSLSTKVFIILAIISLIGIIIRWDYTLKEAKRGFDYFKTQDDDSTKMMTK